MSDMSQGPGGGPPGPGYQQPAYPPYGQNPGHGRPSKTNSMAIVSLVCGFASLAMCPLISIAGLITGYSARRTIRESNGEESGDGLALGGIITSYLGLALMVLAVVMIVAVTLLGSNSTSKFSSVASAIS